MTRKQLEQLVTQLDDFIDWLEATEDPTFDLAAVRWTRYLAKASALILRDLGQ